MSSVIVCPACQSKLGIDPNNQSPQVRCPRCAAVVDVPGFPKMTAGRFTVAIPDTPDTRNVTGLDLAFDAPRNSAPAATHQTTVEPASDPGHPDGLRAILGMAKWFALGV